MHCIIITQCGNDIRMPGALLCAMHACMPEITSVISLKESADTPIPITHDENERADDAE